MANQIIDKALAYIGNQAAYVENNGWQRITTNYGFIVWYKKSFNTHMLKIEGTSTNTVTTHTINLPDTVEPSYLYNEIYIQHSSLPVRVTLNQRELKVDTLGSSRTVYVNATFVY